jgi:hypothetical protein
MAEPSPQLRLTEQSFNKFSVRAFHIQSERKRFRIGLIASNQERGELLPKLASVNFSGTVTENQIAQVVG